MPMCSVKPTVFKASAYVTSMCLAPGKTPKDIPWLKLAATSHRGKGLFSDVTTIQRINTAGGQLEGASSAAGSFNSVPYATDYVFLKK